MPIIVEYLYDGLGQRIGWHYDVNASGGGPDASDPWYWFISDDRWRIVSTFRRVARPPSGLWGLGGALLTDVGVMEE